MSNIQRIRITLELDIPIQPSDTILGAEFGDAMWRSTIHAAALHHLHIATRWAPGRLDNSGNPIPENHPLHRYHVQWSDILLSDNVAFKCEKA